MLTRCCLDDGDYQLDGGDMLLTKGGNRVIEFTALKKNGNGRKQKGASDALE